jgi:class 3 adenylate cyclase
LSRTARSALQPQPARLRPGEGVDEDEAVAARGSEDLVQKIGLHEGPCLAANARQNDFGPTVNIASRMQGPAERR